MKVKSQSKVIDHKTETMLLKALKRGKFNPSDIDYLKEFFGVQLCVNNCLLAPIEVEMQEIEVMEMPIFEIQVEDWNNLAQNIELSESIKRVRKMQTIAQI